MKTPRPSVDATFAVESPRSNAGGTDAARAATPETAIGSDDATAFLPSDDAASSDAFDDDRLLPISGLQHLAFCPRQCALIHRDGVWSENFFTAAGRVMHERVHNADSETRGDVRTARGLWLRSKRLGLVGIADVVEFRRVDSPFDDADSETQTTETTALNDAAQTLDAASQPNATERPVVAVKLPKRRGFWRPYPVEYKRGQPKKNNCDAVQLCAQAICLEESLGCAILEGALFYGTTKRRVAVRFDAALRAETEELAQRFHALLDADVAPEPVASARCKSCSLADECLPDARKSASRYLRDNWREAGAFDVSSADADAPQFEFPVETAESLDDEDFA
ncbi:MAG: CRISPR-associated protein Cas4 [Thermoguttaceae bacterium]|nr:CRISPR-associated protein Cas4 [Thermoguttaceae bacterium]MBQ6828861.1 CRISPR-associated protein Cas4 [Thermoguttaceae bacterium]